MAFFDVEAEQRRLEKEDSYKRLKAFIADPRNKSEFFMASFYMSDLESENEELKKKLQKFYKFFADMQDLLPSNDPYRVIG